jgi:molybdopterin synthase sulfur carrier subunit
VKVTVKFFARYRDIIGEPEIEVEVDNGANVASLIAKLADKHADFPADPSMVAVNAEYVDYAVTLSQGDEVAFFPPFSGG